MRNKFALVMYRFLYGLASATIASYSLFAMRGFRRIKEGFTDYLGLLEPVKSAYGKPVFWVHGVSMGESMVAIGFVEELKNNFKNCRIVFTTTHPDVYANVKKRKIADRVAYFPLDNYFSVKRAFERWKPTAVFVSETDFWPEFSWRCKNEGVPLFLINGRISEKIERSYSKMPSIAEIVFGSYSLFAVQSLSDKARLDKLGVDDDKIKVLGNIKADLLSGVKPIAKDIAEWKGNEKCIVFGSVHPTEYEIIKPLLINRKEKIIIAPRNLDNSKKWHSELVKLGVKACLRSNLQAEANVMTLDTMGELASVYSLANVAFVGGSIDKKVGGHNPLEIIQQNVPLICGVNCRNFADIMAELKNVHGVEIVCDAKSIGSSIDKILGDKDYADNMAKNAFNVLQNNKGALIKTINIVKQILKNSKHFETE